MNLEPVKQLEPFGLSVRPVSPGADLAVVPTPLLKQWIDEHRFVVLKGFAPLNGPALPDFCRSLGELLEWEFGSVNDLRVDPETKNYLYTNRAVPFHWDGAFLPRSPHYIFFHCDAAPDAQSGGETLCTKNVSWPAIFSPNLRGSLRALRFMAHFQRRGYGDTQSAQRKQPSPRLFVQSRGETLFCDTVRLLAHAPSELQRLWEQVVITYTTEKIVHYGGTFSSPLLTSHPTMGFRVLRYAEPVEDLNPVKLSIEGMSEERQPAFMEDMHRRLNDERCCYAYRWECGDVVIADNHALLHGRRAFANETARHIRRVNIL